MRRALAVTFVMVALLFRPAAAQRDRVVASWWIHPPPYRTLRVSRDADRRQIDERTDAGTYFAIEQVAQPSKVCGARTPGVA